MVRLLPERLPPLRAAAVEQAIRLKEQKVATEVVACTVGPAAAQEQLRTALAMGCDRAIHVVTDEETLPIHVAKVFKALAEKEEPKMVLLGKQVRRRQQLGRSRPRARKLPVGATTVPAPRRRRRLTTTATRQGRCLRR